MIGEQRADRRPPLAAAQRTAELSQAGTISERRWVFGSTANERCMLFDAQNRAIISKPRQINPAAVVANIAASRNAGAQPGMTPDPCFIGIAVVMIALPQAGAPAILVSSLV
jgi:hypothetical protein